MKNFLILTFLLSASCMFSQNMKENVFDTISTSGTRDTIINDFPVRDCTSPFQWQINYYQDRISGTVTDTVFVEYKGAGAEKWLISDTLVITTNPKQYKFEGSSLSGKIRTRIVTPSSTQVVRVDQCFQKSN